MTAKKKPATQRAPQKRKRQPGKAHDAQLKAQVIAALLLGGGVSEVATQLGLAHSTVSTYKAGIPEGKLAELRHKKGDRLDEMVYDYMLASLEALTKQAHEVSRASYIQRQKAGELATLHGVMADKAVRLLEVTTRTRGVEPQRLGDGESSSESA